MLDAWKMLVKKFPMLLKASPIQEKPDGSSSESGLFLT
jgi:hypothetical protein